MVRRRLRPGFKTRLPTPECDCKDAQEVCDYCAGPSPSPGGELQYWTTTFDPETGNVQFVCHQTASQQPLLRSVGGGVGVRSRSASVEGDLQLARKRTRRNDGTASHQTDRRPEAEGATVTVQSSPDARAHDSAVDVPATQHLGMSTHPPAATQYWAMMNWLQVKLPNSKDATRNRMAETAGALASDTELRSLRRWLQGWRRFGHPSAAILDAEIGQAELGHSSEFSGLGSTADLKLVALFIRLKHTEKNQFLHAVHYRVAHADFADHYEKLQRTMPQSKGRSPKAQAQAMMYRWCYPSDMSLAERKKSQSSFARTVRESIRWAKMRTRLGAGMFGLMALRVQDSWLSIKLTNAEFDTWMDLIQEKRPMVCQLAEALSDLLAKYRERKRLTGEPTMLECAADDELDVDKHGRGWLQVPEPSPIEETSGNDALVAETPHYGDILNGILPNGSSDLDLNLDWTWADDSVDLSQGGSSGLIDGAVWAAGGHVF